MVLHRSAHLMSRNTDNLSSGLSFKIHFYSKQSWKLNNFYSGAKVSFACSPLCKRLQSPNLEAPQL